MLYNSWVRNEKSQGKMPLHATRRLLTTDRIFVILRNGRILAGEEHMRKMVWNRWSVIPLAIFFIWIFLGTILVFCHPSAWRQGAIVIGTVILCAALFSLVCPLVYSFDKDGLTVYYGFGIRKRVKWAAIKSVSEAYGYHGWRHYRIEGFVSKFPIYRRGVISKTKKTTRLLQTYWHGKVN